MKFSTALAGMRIGAFIVAALCSASVSAQTQTTQKYFGYFAGNYPIDFNVSPLDSSLPEMRDHINLYSIMDWSGDKSAAGMAATESQFLQELAKAKASHVHAIVSAFPFLLKSRDSGNQKQAFDPAGVEVWHDFARKMVAQGYLVPGDSARSTVVAVYGVDEPNSDGADLWDVNGAARPDLVSLTDAIRQTAETSALPIATILTNDFSGFEQGMQLFDWVGFDHYGDSDSKWTRTFNSLKALVPNKKYIVVPGAMQGCDDVSVEPTGRYFSAIESDPNVTWIAPFVWFSHLNGKAGCLGVRDLPSLKASYTAEGLKIRGLQCSTSVGEKNFCAGKSFSTSAINLLLGD